MQCYGGRDAVKQRVRDVVKPGTFGGDCGVIAYALLAGTSYGDALYATQAAGYVRGDGIDSGDLARLIADTVPGAEAGFTMVPGNNLVSFLAERPGWTGLAIVAGSDGGHAVPVVDGFAYNVDAVQATQVPMFQAQQIAR